VFASARKSSISATTTIPSDRRTRSRDWNPMIEPLWPTNTSSSVARTIVPRP
jgi:hypothetical protein